jgi:hypothetical protein
MLEGDLFIQPFVTLTACLPKFPQDEVWQAAPHFPGIRLLPEVNISSSLRGHVMSIDQVLRAAGTVACLYTVAIAVSAMTMASLGAVSYSTASLCSGRECRPSGQAHTKPVTETAYEAVFLAPLTLFDSSH